MLLSTKFLAFQKALPRPSYFISSACLIQTLKGKGIWIVPGTNYRAQLLLGHISLEIILLLSSRSLFIPRHLSLVWLKKPPFLFTEISTDFYKRGISDIKKGLVLEAHLCFLGFFYSTSFVWIYRYFFLFHSFVWCLHGACFRLELAFWSLFKQHKEILVHRSCSHVLPQLCQRRQCGHINSA